MRIRRLFQHDAGQTTLLFAICTSAIVANVPLTARAVAVRPKDPNCVCAILSGNPQELQSGGSFDIGAEVTGDGVTSYKCGSIGGIDFLGSAIRLGSFSLNAPTSRTFGRVLLMQKHLDTTPDAIVANSATKTASEGTAHFPTAQATCAVAGTMKSGILMAKDRTFAARSFSSATVSSTTFGDDSSALQDRCPLAGGGSVLVQ